MILTPEAMTLAKRKVVMPPNTLQEGLGHRVTSSDRHLQACLSIAACTVAARGSCLWSSSVLRPPCLPFASLAQRRGTLALR